MTDKSSLGQGLATQAFNLLILIEKNTNTQFLKRYRYLAANATSTDNTTNASTKKKSSGILTIALWVVIGIIVVGGCVIVCSTSGELPEEYN